MFDLSNTRIKACVKTNLSSLDPRNLPLLYPIFIAYHFLIRFFSPLSDPPAKISKRDPTGRKYLYPRRRRQIRILNTHAYDRDRSIAR